MNRMGFEPYLAGTKQCITASKVLRVLISSAVMPLNRTAMNDIGLMLFLTVAVALGGCATQPPEQRDNAELRRTIHDAVPDTWRGAADSSKEISPLAVSADLRTFVLSAVRSNATARERMLTLTEAVVDPGGVGLVYDAAATHTASEAFQTGLGNCMGFSNLLVAAAREAGLNAQFELVSQNLRWDNVDGVLVGSQHVRVVSFVGARKMVLDFYPLPIESGISAQLLTDTDALAHHINNLATESMQDGDNARAYALLYRAIETSPSTAFVWSNLGVLLSRHQLYLLAESAFKEAFLISPDGLTPLSNLQRLYYSQGRHAEAAKLMDQIEEYRARNPYYHSRLANDAYERGNYQDAVEHFKDAIALKENESAFYVGLSKSYEQLGNSRAALRASRKARAFDEPKVTSYRVRHRPPKTGTRIPH